MFTTDREFEDEVRRIARLLWPAAQYDGAAIVDQRERDGVFETSEFINAIECTVSRSRDKAVEDTSKLEKLHKRMSAKVPQKKVVCWFVTLNEPTADQRGVVGRTQGRVIAVSFDQFRSKIVDARSYLIARGKYPFGSVRDPETGSSDFKPDYVPLDILDQSGNGYTAEEIVNLLCAGARIVLLGDYGAGKSATARQLFHLIGSRFWKQNAMQFPVILNLRDHHGQTDPVEAIERHARRVGFPAERTLVQAWRGGFIHLILDGFDEVASAGWAGRTTRLRDLRYRSMELLRSFVKESPSSVGILITGRAHFFDNQKELSGALGLAPTSRVFALNEFNPAQVETFLRRSKWRGVIPDWLPSRPLLLAYLVSRDLLSKTLGGEQQSGPAVGWDGLLQRIAEREAEIEAGLDAETVRTLIEWLATLARSSVDGLGPLSPDTIVDAFREICGYSPDDRGAVLLRRLPGLSTAQAEDGSRVFIDRDFVEAARAGMVARFAESPFTTKLKPETWQSTLRPLGWSLVALRIGSGTSVLGRVTAALLHASRLPLGATLVTDLLLGLSYCGISYEGDHIYASGVFVPELRMDEMGGSLANVEFQDSVVGLLDLAADVEATFLPMFRRCHFGSVQGRTGEADLPLGRFQDCEFDEFEIAARTTAALLALGLPLSTRVLLTVLKKLYAQAGRGRKESALYRGLDQRAQGLVQDVLSLAQREGFAVRTRQTGSTVWLPARGADFRRRALTILASPSAADDSILNASRELD